MAEERTLGLARVTEGTNQSDSKEELQRRLDQTRDSISQTVTEIKETVAHQVQAVKDTLDWREQFKKRPVAWSAGALGAGFLTGYCIAGMLKSDTYDHVRSTDAYSTPLVRQPEPRHTEPREEQDEGPGVLDRFKQSAAYEKLTNEVEALGTQAVEELSKTASLVVLPFVLAKVKTWLGIDRLEKSIPAAARSTSSRKDWTDPARSPRSETQIGHI
jgi:hypothetical protein